MLIKILIYFVATSMASIVNEVFGFIVGIAGLLFLIKESYKKIIIFVLQTINNFFLNFLVIIFIN